MPVGTAESGREIDPRSALGEVLRSGSDGRGGASARRGPAFRSWRRRRSLDRASRHAHQGSGGNDLPAGVSRTPASRSRGGRGEGTYCSPPSGDDDPAAAAGGRNGFRPPWQGAYRPSADRNHPSSRCPEVRTRRRPRADRPLTDNQDHPVEFAGVSYPGGATESAWRLPPFDLAFAAISRTSTGEPAGRTGA